MGLAILTLTLAVAGCEGAAPSPSTTATDLSAIACATDNPTDVGELTGAWQGDDHGVYYIRQVGDCVWWFGTELVDVQPGLTGMPGFANVASGRVYGIRIEVEYADLPMGDVLGGGGLTLVYDAQNDRLSIIEQRGDWQPFGATTFTRIEPQASAEPISSASASP
jgi:hypothetical protein